MQAKALWAGLPCARVLATSLIGVALLAITQPAVAVPLQAASFTNVHQSPVDDWNATYGWNGAPAPPMHADLVTNPATGCALRLDALPGDPGDAPSRGPANRIEFSASLQCASYLNRATVDVTPSGTTTPYVAWSDYVYDRNWTVRKQIKSLKLEALYPGLVAPQTGNSKVTLPPATTDAFVSAKGVYTSPTIEPLAFRVVAVVRLTDERGPWGFEPQSWYECAPPYNPFICNKVWYQTQPPSSWFAVAAQWDAEPLQGFSGFMPFGDCNNVDEFSGTVTPEHVSEFVAQNSTPYIGIKDQYWRYAPGPTIECTLKSPYFTMADIDGRHFLSSATKYYTSCNFNSQRAGILSGAAHINYANDAVFRDATVSSTVQFTDPAAACTPNDGETWETVPIEFNFEKSGFDPCTSQKISDTQVLKGSLRINNGPPIPAKMTVRMIALGRFAPIVDVDIVNDYSFDTPVSTAPTGQYLDAPVSQLPVLNDEVESITNLYTYLQPMIAPSFGAHAYTTNIKDLSPTTSFPVDHPALRVEADAGACDRRELRFDFAGVLQEPDDREGEVSLGSGLSVDVGPLPEYDSLTGKTGDAVNAAQGGDLINALGSLGSVVKELPKLPFAPAVPYTITAKFPNPTPWLGGGTYVEHTFAGVFGVPTPVILPGVIGTAFIVTLGSSHQMASVKGLTGADGGDYMLRIQKISAPALIGVPLVPNSGPASRGVTPSKTATRSTTDAADPPPPGPIPTVREIIERLISRPLPNPSLPDLLPPLPALPPVGGPPPVPPVTVPGIPTVPVPGIPNLPTLPPVGGPPPIPPVTVPGIPTVPVPGIPTVPTIPVPGIPAIGNPLVKNNLRCSYPVRVKFTIGVGTRDLMKLSGLPPGITNPIADSVSTTALSIGYNTLDNGATSAPEDFMLVLQEHGEHGYSVHQGVFPCASSDPLAIFASYSTSDGQEATIHVAAEQAPAVRSIAFTSFNTDQGVKTLRYNGSSPMNLLKVWGVLGGTTFDVGLRELFNASVCQHDGRACNVGWRVKKKSELSFAFRSWDNNGNLVPAGVYVFAAPPDGVPSTFDVRLSSFAVDAKLMGVSRAFEQAVASYSLIADVASQNYVKAAADLVKWFSANANFPYWGYLTTDRQNVSGSVSTSFISFSAETGFWAKSREVRLVRYLLWPWLRTRGRISCGDLSLHVETTPISINYLPDGYGLGDFIFDEKWPGELVPNPSYYTLSAGQMDYLIKKVLCNL
jgi:hypothetical protein